MQALARHGASAHLAGGELPDGAQPAAALAAPGALLLQLRGAAAAVGVPVTLANAGVGFGGGQLSEIEARAFECGVYRGVDIGPVGRLMLSEMGDAMFEPAAWTEFREWAARVRARGAALGGGGGGAPAGAAAAPPAPPPREAGGAPQPADAEAPAQQQQPQQQPQQDWQMAVLA
jgi:hypothetical protein